MAFYKDLEPCTYFRRRPFRSLLAAGWLSGGEDYAQGEIRPEEKARLCALLPGCWDPFGPNYRGQHTCELCSEARGQRNLFVPADGLIFVAPELVRHYVDAHGYLPPRAFLDAVLACPDMGSASYLSELIRAGGKDFAWHCGLLAPHCPDCGSPLGGVRTRQCRACRIDWYDLDNPRKLGSASASLEPER